MQSTVIMQPCKWLLYQQLFSCEKQTVALVCATWGEREERAGQDPGKTDFWLWAQLWVGLYLFCIKGCQRMVGAIDNHLPVQLMLNKAGRGTARCLLTRTLSAPGPVTNRQPVGFPSCCRVTTGGSSSQRRLRGYLITIHIVFHLSLAGENILKLNMGNQKGGWHDSRLVAHSLLF